MSRNAVTVRSFMKKKRPDALLIQPPPGDLTGPYPALCYLKSFAAEKAYRVDVRDLNIEAFYHLSDNSQVRRLVEHATHGLRELEKKGDLNPNEQHQYNLLLSSLGVGLNTDLQAQITTYLKRPKYFYDYHSYKKGCRLLDAFYRLLSAVHHPTTVTASEYPTATVLRTMPKVLEHCKLYINPYMRYYEDVLIPQIAAENPSVIGISMVFASQSVQALVLGHLLKQRFPDSHITLGGAYLSQWVMNMQADQLRELFRCADSVICGEGEASFTILLERIINGKPLDDIPNLIHYQTSTGKFHRFKKLIYTDVPTQPPPDFSDLDLSKYLIPETIIPYSISRGCYWGKCVFCQNRYGDHQMRRYQTVPVEKAIKEMTALSEKYHSQHFNFSNDVIDPSYLIKFSQTVTDTGKSFIWNTDLRAEKAFNKNTCKQMAKAGLNSVAIGFESGCQKTLDAMDKGNRIETTRSVLKNLYESGIATQVMGIFGFPGETEKDGEETVRFLEENEDRISYYVIGLLMVMPGSRMHDNPHEFGVSSISYANNPMKTPEPVWISNTRMPLDAVHRLYQRLGRLENVYAINEYPYVGGLSTNHSFLYFRLGPDILKRLQQKEKEHHYKLHMILDRDVPPQKSKAIKSIVPVLMFPYKVYQSPYAVESILIDSGKTATQERLSKEDDNNYLVDPINTPIRIGALEIALLRRINGQRNLRAILNKIAPNHQKRALSFVMYLLVSGLVDVRGFQYK
jgi:anaerobic magnesium-protoporphyrin IX monomethyl ester cyclase